MIATTTPTIQGHEIQEYLGIVNAEIVYGTNAVKDFFAGVRDFTGGRSGSYEKVLTKAHKKALEELQEEAEKMGANAIVGVEFDSGSINVEQKGALLVVTATGTAVKI